MLKLNTTVPDEADRVLEDPRLWVDQLHTNMKTLAFTLGISETTLRKSARAQGPRVQQRLQDVHTILERVTPWFDSVESAWLWFRSAPVPSFGRKSPSEVMREHGDMGFQIIMRYVERKEAGGYE